MNPIPRPILKRDPHPSCYGSDLPFESYAINAVHFPPPTSLIQQYDAYPSSTYDRSPITVSPNTCALPERGCPGRTYNPDEGTSKSYCSPSKRSSYRPGGHVHPRALTAQPPRHPYPASVLEPPPLVPDLSSESEESDGFISPPPERVDFTGRSTPHPREKYPSPALYTSIPTYPSSPSYSQSPCLLDSKGRRRRSRERTTSRHPKPNGDYKTATPSVPSTPRRSRDRSICAAMSSFSIQDDAGCLGGF